MTSALNFSSSLVVVLLAAAFFASPACSTSQQALEHPHNKGFRVELKHVDSGKNLTKFEQIQLGIKRGRQRLQKVNPSVYDSKSAPQILGPISSGNGIGEFLLEFKMGTPGVSISAILDTGSDLVWVHCYYRKQNTPFYDPGKSSSYSALSCSSTLCEALPQVSCGRGCNYFYSYGDHSYTEGLMGTEIFIFGPVFLPKVAIGCGVDKKDDGFEPGSALVGLGRGPLSLVSQLEESIFAYCVSYAGNTKAGILLMGSLASLNIKPNEIKTTPLIRNPSMPSFYYLSLEGITVGGTTLPIKKFLALEDGEGGLIIDSGTTVTFLPETVFDPVAKLFTQQTKLTVDSPPSSELPLCFKFPMNVDKVGVPELIFHFDGADLKLPVENYIIVDKLKGLLCLAMVSTKGGLSIFGNFQQQNILVIHDLVKETVSFVPRQCADIR
ncbi:aspartyl protease family protein [Tripterygium wilfordii]|uniref:Aspartyl protease family protein n=1 Tax=Tripterygium wilfordii TaxID=458696 RepID=A0A7J7DF82_TRIWF|nr:aspartic proteinase nepenthesin-1-like [Tripterygium wilfordii]KAF5745055.1 aspartyl protease family protein [Tripterygium wilfordii]